MKIILYFWDGEKHYALSTTENPGFPYWLENQDGEGMSLSEKNVFDILDEYFKKEF